MRKPKYSTTEMEVCIARYFGIRQNIIVPNVFWGAGFRHELDIMVITKSQCAYEVEIKVSKADLKKDAEKKHGHIDPEGRIKRLYFAIPEYLKDNLDMIPERDGILLVRRDKHLGKLMAHEHRPAKEKKPFYKWKDDEIMNIVRLGAMRIWGLKEKLINKQIKIWN